MMMNTEGVAQGNYDFSAKPRIMNAKYRFKDPYGKNVE